MVFPMLYGFEQLVVIFDLELPETAVRQCEMGFDNGNDGR